MKVILYMAITANGYIAKEDHETPWSDEEWESFSNIVKKIGNLIIGKKTFEIMEKNNEFEKIGNPFTVVLSEDVSPEKAISLMEEKGFSEVLVAGGGITNTSFIDIIDEMYLDIEPLLLGKGIKLFSEKDFEKKLELIDTKKLSENTIQLHYRVISSE